MTEAGMACPGKAKRDARMIADANFMAIKAVGRKSVGVVNVVVALLRDLSMLLPLYHLTAVKVIHTSLALVKVVPGAHNASIGSGFGLRRCIGLTFRGGRYRCHRRIATGSRCLPVLQVPVPQVTQAQVRAITTS